MDRVRWQVGDRERGRRRGEAGKRGVESRGNEGGWTDRCPRASASTRASAVRTDEHGEHRNRILDGAEFLSDSRT